MIVEQLLFGTVVTKFTTKKALVGYIVKLICMKFKTKKCKEISRGVSVVRTSSFNFCDRLLFSLRNVDRVTARGAFRKPSTFELRPSQFSSGLSRKYQDGNNGAKLTPPPPPPPPAMFHEMSTTACACKLA